MMETTRFQVYKVNEKHSKIFLVFCAVISILGLWGILIIWLSDNPEFLNLKLSSYVFFLIQGVFGIVLIRKNFKNINYFVSWNDNEIQYQLPKDKEPVIIKIHNIQSVEKTNRDIRIKLHSGEIKNFSYNYFYFPTRQTIFDYFDWIKNQAEISNMPKK